MWLKLSRIDITNHWRNYTTSGQISPVAITTYGTDAIIYTAAVPDLSGLKNPDRSKATH